MNDGQFKIPRVMIAGTHSGVGKTTITTGIMSALTKAGGHVQPFKVGPDYIDPTYHSAATGNKSRNLDTWILGDQKVYDIFLQTAVQADIAIIEGVMGVFDGSSGKLDTGSSAYIAKLLRCPVILIVDVKSMARSAAALVSGFVNFDPEVNIAGVILNRVGSERHLKIVQEAIEEYCEVPVIGWVPKNSILELPSRHLGLIPTGEGKHLRDATKALAAAIEIGISLDKLWEAALNAEPLPRSWAAEGKPNLCQETKKPAAVEKVKIGLPLDEAFSFYYQDGLDLLEESGAELVPFSPLHDKHLPAGLAGLYLGGGFPEVFVKDLAENHGIMEEIRSVGQSGMPILAECGGYMYLAKELVEVNGCRHSMVGLIPAVCMMEKKLAGMGYVEAHAITDNILVAKGQVVRGHEFHYSKMEPEDPGKFPYAYVLERNRYQETIPDGYVKNNILASYVHHHFASNQEIATRFISKCKNYCLKVEEVDANER